MWNCHGILRALIIVWVIWDVNSGPLSDWKEVGIPNRGMIWVTVIDATVVALLLEVGKVPPIPRKCLPEPEGTVSLYSGHICKVYLPICPRDVSPGLVSREWAGPQRGVWVSPLISGTCGGEWYRYWESSGVRRKNEFKKSLRF
jgi:hypothetical protein